MTAALCLLGAAVGEAVVYDGGFSPPSRIAFGALAAAALVGAIAVDRRAAWRLAREPPVAVLLTLAALGAASVAWTVGLGADAGRWALVVAGYAAVLVVAAVVGGATRGVEAVAALVCVLALVSGVVGLAAVAGLGEPFADRVGGTWRPGGTLEYSAALALLQVSALPALLAGMSRGSRPIRCLACVGGGVAAAVLALSGSRAELALAGLVCLAAAVAPRRTVRAGRAAVVVALCVLAAVGAGAHAVASSTAGRDAAASRDALRATSAAAAIPRATRPDGEHDGGFWHGRLHTWRAAAETAGDRPLTGAGADAFLAGSARHQREGPVRFAHDLPLELAAELGIAGALLALALYATAGAAVWRARGSRGGWLLGPPAIAFLAAGLVDWPWHLAGSGAVWAASLGALIGAVRASEYRRSGIGDP